MKVLHLDNKAVSGFEGAVSQHKINSLINLALSGYKLVAAPSCKKVISNLKNTKLRTQTTTNKSIIFFA